MILKSLSAWIQPQKIHLFNTMQYKLQLLTAEAQQLARAAEKPEEAPTAAVAAQEQCKRIVVDFFARNR